MTFSRSSTVALVVLNHQAERLASRSVEDRGEFASPVSEQSATSGHDATVYADVVVHHVRRLGLTPMTLA